jgi:hypothetical protein
MLNTKLHCTEETANFFGTNKYGMYCNYFVLMNISFMSVAQILRHYLHKNTDIRRLIKKK